jgi:DNA-directed RNA polymerase specialized sigma24 family protein
VFEEEVEWVEDGFKESVPEGVRRATAVEVAARYELAGQLAAYRRHGVELLTVQQWSQQEIARLLGLSVNTVKKMMTVSRRQAQEARKAGKL